MLDLTSFQRAIAQLEEALAYCESDLAQKDPSLARQLRAAAIRAFEFTYEMAVKILKRFLEATEPNPAAAEEMSFNALAPRGPCFVLRNKYLRNFVTRIPIPGRQKSG